MKKIFFSEPESLENKRLLRALEIELTERGAEITRDIFDSFDAAVTFDALEIDSSVSVFYLCYETDDVPDGAAINEAVELAKRYCGDETPTFINGMLSSYAAQLSQEEK